MAMNATLLHFHRTLRGQICFSGVLQCRLPGGQLADVDVAWNPMASDGLPAAKAMAQVFQVLGVSQLSRVAECFLPT